MAVCVPQSVRQQQNCGQFLENPALISTRHIGPNRLRDSLPCGSVFRGWPKAEQGTKIFQCSEWFPVLIDVEPTHDKNIAILGELGFCTFDNPRCYLPAQVFVGRRERKLA